MKASDAIAKILADNQVTYGFELMGGMIAHIIDSINKLGETKLISVHHEQGAAFAAGAISRASSHKQMGLALGTSGPGATNLITGIADCWLDSHPCLFITGQVNTYEQKGELAIRQQGFQELDIISMVKGITKYAHQIQTSDELLPCLMKAIAIAKDGRCGPVLLDIPMDIQCAEVDESLLLSRELKAFIKTNNNKLDNDFHDVLTQLEQAKKPLFLIGGGAVNEDSFQSWVAYISKNKLPYIASLKGAEKTIATYEYFGMIGAYGTRTANYAAQSCDLLVVVGSRMDVRQTGAKVEDFARCAKVIQIDVDANQLDNRVDCQQSICSDCESFFQYSLNSELNRESNDSEWMSDLQKHFSHTFVDEYREWSISPFEIMQCLNKQFFDYPVHYVADVGNNQMWAAHSLRLQPGKMAHYSGGLGAMGFAIPSSIGIYYASYRPVVVITGDGGAQLNIQELDIIAREHLPILIIVLNNASLGMVRGFQEMYFEGRNSSTYWNGYSTNFKELGSAYGLKSFSVDALNDFSRIVKAFVDSPCPCLVEVMMSDARECRPRLEFGNTLDNQTPNFQLNARE